MGEQEAKKTNKAGNYQIIPPSTALATNMITKSTTILATEQNQVANSCTHSLELRDDRTQVVTAVCGPYYGNREVINWKP